jgi:hypothetical protein
MDKYMSILRQEIQFLTYADLPESHPVVQASYQRIIDARRAFLMNDVLFVDQSIHGHKTNEQLMN